MMYLAGSGSCFNEITRINGHLHKDDNGLHFSSTEFTLPYDENFYSRLSKIAKEKNKFLELYIKKHEYYLYLK